MLIPSHALHARRMFASLSRRVNANSQLERGGVVMYPKLIKKGEC